MATTYKRDLNNLRGDAETTGHEFGFRLRAFLFDFQWDVWLDWDWKVPAGSAYTQARGPALEGICRTLRGMGWTCEIVECDDGENRIHVEVK